MSEQLPPFKDLLTTLFEKSLNSNGKRYTDREVAAAIRANGTPISASYLSMLRKGVREPSYSYVRALIQFFGVPPGYFFEFNVYDKWRKHLDGEGEPQFPSPRKPQRVLLRGFVGMSERSQSLIQLLAEHVGELETNSVPHGRDD